jgi:hypothetical protein
MQQDAKEVAQLHAQMGVLHRALGQDDLAQSHLKRYVAKRETDRQTDRQRQKEREMFTRETEI